MNYHLIIDAGEEFREFGLVILKYWEESQSNKGMTPYFFDGHPRFSYEQLTEMISLTHSIWMEILEGRKQEQADDDGPLFGWTGS